VNVLIADDDRVLNLLLANLFRKKGWTVSSALDAMQVLMLAMRARPDAIVLDINMPGGTGVEALKKLKASAKTAHIPVVVLSGSINPADQSTVIELGASEFLAKPANPEQVYETVVRLAGGPPASA
jgi:two-component system cell cycle response regulator